VIRCRSQEKSVFTVQTLLIAGVPLSMTRSQMNRIRDTCNPASVFNLHDPLLE
jgi:hypothetical protein